MWMFIFVLKHSSESSSLPGKLLRKTKHIFLGLILNQVAYYIVRVIQMVVCESSTSLLNLESSISYLACGYVIKQ